MIGQFPTFRVTIHQTGTVTGVTMKDACLAANHIGMQDTRTTFTVEQLDGAGRVIATGEFSKVRE